MKRASLPFRRALRAVVGVVVGVGLVVAGALVGPGTVARADASPPTIGHVWQIVLENESEPSAFAPGSYLHDTLVPSGVFLPNFYGTGHVSLDNYLSAISGQLGNAATFSDCQLYVDFVGTVTPGGVPAGAGCVYPDGPLTRVLTLPDQLTAAGRTWHGYMEDMGNDVNAAGVPTRETLPCGQPVGSTPGQAASTTPPGTSDDTQSATATDQYAARHNPFVYFHSLVDVPAGQTSSPCQRNVVPLVTSPHLPGVNGLAQDLQLADPPAFNFITPNLCDDGHDTDCAGVDVDGLHDGGLVSANRFLQHYVPMIEASAAYQHDGLIVVNFDEAADTDLSSCCHELAGTSGVQLAGGGGRTGALLLSPLLTPHTSRCAYNHFSLLHTYEDLFGITTGGADGAGHLGMAATTEPFGTDVYGAIDTCTPGPTVPEVPHTVWLALGGLAAIGLVLVVTRRAAAEPAKRTAARNRLRA